MVLSVLALKFLSDEWEKNKGSSKAEVKSGCALNEGAAPATKTRLGKTNIALSTDVLSPEILSQSFAHNNLM
jgi:hypothetical protein